MEYRRLLNKCLYVRYCLKTSSFKDKKARTCTNSNGKYIYVRGNRLCVTIYRPCIQDSAPVPIYSCFYKSAIKQLKRVLLSVPTYIAACAVCNSTKRYTWVSTRPSIVDRATALWAEGPRYGGSICSRNNAFSLIRPPCWLKGPARVPSSGTPCYEWVEIYLNFHFQGHGV